MATRPRTSSPGVPREAEAGRRGGAWGPGPPHLLREFGGSGEASRSRRGGEGIRLFSKPLRSGVLLPASHLPGVRPAQGQGYGVGVALETDLGSHLALLGCFSRITNTSPPSSRAVLSGPFQKGFKQGVGGGEGRGARRPWRRQALVWVGIPGWALQRSNGGFFWRRSVSIPVSPSFSSGGGPPPSLDISLAIAFAVLSAENGLHDPGIFAGLFIYLCFSSGNRTFSGTLDSL